MQSGGNSERARAWRPLAWGGIAGVVMVFLAAAVWWYLQPKAVSDSQLFVVGLKAAEWGEFAAARSVIRGLRERGREEHAAIVLAKTLIAKGFYQPAVEVLSGSEEVSLET